MSQAADGFRPAYDRAGNGPPLLVLHGWPGDRPDWRAVRALLAGHEVIAPDLRGFGGSDQHRQDPALAYPADAQARGAIGLLAELELGPVVIAGYGVGSRIAQAVAAARPGLVRALVIAPPL